MRRRAPALVLAALLALLLPVSRSAAAPSVPANFAVDDAVPGAGFVVPTGIAFLPDGRFFVAEKRGRVYEVRQGVKRPAPLWSAENEVLDLGDRGLLGIAVDPNYFVNHYLYLLYVADPDSNGTDNNTFAYGRLARYQVNFTDSASVIPASRTILMGHNWTNGPVQASDSHAIGSLRWGRDGSLLVSIGDGAHYEYTDDGGNDAAAFGAGRTDPNEDIGSFRSQDITGLAGKILRVNPADGHGYASNPFVNGNLASPQSRVWSYGLRNPFRFTVRPGTGSPDTSAANPGTLFIGDVGYNNYEEMDVARTGGVNFGWPCYEGTGALNAYQFASPAHNGCGSFGTATNPSPARAPVSHWHHSSGSQSSPTGLVGNCSVGGAFYTGSTYPAQYRNQYLFADYGGEWIRLATFDVNDNLLSIAGFMTAADSPVDLATDPVSGDVFYVSITTNQVRRIRYTAGTGGNTPPVAAIAATPLAGTAPLSVSFSSAGSSDPNGDPLTYAWVFTDGTGSTEANPTHVFSNSGSYVVQLTVSDGRGGTDIKYVTITASPAQVAFPSTPVLDNFNRANGAIGAAWVDQTAGFSISGNTLAPGSGTASIEWGGTSFGSDQEVYVTLAALDAAATEQNLMLKTQGAGWSSGHIEVWYSHANSTVTVVTYAPGIGWANVGMITGVRYAVGDRFGARALGDGAVQVFRNTSLLGTVSVTAWPYYALGGRIGVSTAGAAAARYDDFGGGNVISNQNTKPVATITSPAQNSFFATGGTVNLVGTATDAQSPEDSLTFRWTVDLLHNNHVHPSSFNAVGPTASFPAANHDDGTGVHLMIKLAVADPQGLVSDTARVEIWPEIDLTAGAVTVTPDPPVAGQSANFAFPLANGGSMPAPGSRWVLRAGGTKLAEGDVVVPANGSVNVAVDATVPAAGNYALRLTADSLGTVRETNEANNATTRALTVNPAPGNVAPAAVAVGVPQSGTAPLTVSFSGATSTDANGDSLTFAWAFGDGGTATGRLASRTYTAAGNYAAVLTVNDGRGGTDTASVAIAVTSPPPPPGGFPQTAVLDNFNRANGAIGASWVDQTTAFSIASNVLRPANGDNYIEWATAFGTNQEAFVTLSTVQATAPEHNLLLKVQGSTWRGGLIEVSYNAAAGRVSVITFTPPSAWATVGTINGVTFSAGDQFGARALADGTVQVFRNGAQVGTASVAGWPYAALGGRIGVATGRAPNARFDNFGGGNFVTDLNTKPVASITAPAANSFYATGQTVTLTGTATDGQTPSGSLTYGWVVDRVFGSHVEPAWATYPGATASFTAADYDDGSGVRLRVKFTAADPQGLVSDTAQVEIWPQIDLAAGAVTVTPDPPVAGQSANYAFTLSNLGPMPAPGSRWVLRAGGTNLAEGNAAVPANGGVNVAVDATLAAAGSYALRVTADSLGAVRETNETNNATTRTLTVNPVPGNVAPVAVAVGVPQSGTAPLTVSFSGATSTDANGDSLTFAWAFGDGGTATGRLASRTYTAAGNYAAILTVNDGRGGTDTASVAIAVTSPPPPPGGFPQTAVLDNFNRANGAIGASWMDQTTSFSIASNVLRPGNGDPFIEWVTAFGTNQEAFVTLSTVQATAPEHNLLLKVQGSSWNAGLIEVSYDAPGARVFVYTFTPPSSWGTSGTINGVTFAAGDQFGARALADGTVQVYKNGAQVGTASVAGWPYAALGGRIGVATGRAPNARFDNFGGGSVPAALALAEPPTLAGRMALPGTVSLSGAFPNPTSGGVAFSLALPREDIVSFSVVDIQGREVWNEAARRFDAGAWSLRWDGRGRAGAAPTGLYLARVRVGAQVFLRRIAIVH